MPDEPNGAGETGETEPTTPASTESSSGELSEGAKKALAAARKDAKEAQKRAIDAEARLKEIDDRDKSESQRSADAKAQAERERDEAKAEVAQIRREGWILNAASAAKFLDPDDAVALLRGEELEDASDAKRAIEKLAKAKPHLVGVREPTAGAFSGGQRGGGKADGNGDMNDEMRRRLGIST